MKATSALQSAALYQHAVFFHCFVNDSVQLGTVKVCWYSSHIYQSSARFQRLLAGFALLLLLAFSNAGQETCSSWKNKNTHTAAVYICGHKHTWAQHCCGGLPRTLHSAVFLDNVWRMEGLGQCSLEIWIRRELAGVNVCAWGHYLLCFPMIVITKQRD